MQTLGMALTAMVIGGAVLLALFWPYRKLGRSGVILRLGLLLLIAGSSIFGLLATLELEDGSARRPYQLVYGGLLFLALASGGVGIRHLVRLQERRDLS